MKPLIFAYHNLFLMQLDKYPLYSGTDNSYYEFFSEGPKGRIKKVIQFHLLSAPSAPIYNLGFGDWREKGEYVDDLIVSNNQDRKKVLATVAYAVIDFTEKNRDAYIVAQGSTAARTRLYQMGISGFYEHASNLFYISGYLRAEWIPFQKGRNYEAFLIRRK